MPFAGIQRAWALRIFEGALFLGAVAGVELLRRRAGASRSWAIGLLCGFPFLLGLEAGQASLLVFFLYALGVTLAPRRPVLGGLALGLTGLKPDLLPLIAPAVLGAGWRAIPAAAGACLWPLLSLLTAGPAGLAAMASRLLAVSGRTTHNIGASLASLVPLTGRAETVLTAALLAWRWRAGRPLAAPWVDVATAVVLAFLPYAFIYDLVFLAAPILRLTKSDRVMGLWWLVPLEATAIGQDGYRGFASLFPVLIAAFLVRRLVRGASTPASRAASLARPATLAAEVAS